MPICHACNSLYALRKTHCSLWLALFSFAPLLTCSVFSSSWFTSWQCFYAGPLTCCKGHGEAELTENNHCITSLRQFICTALQCLIIPAHNTCTYVQNNIKILIMNGLMKWLKTDLHSLEMCRRLWLKAPVKNLISRPWIKILSNE